MFLFSLLFPDFLKLKFQNLRVFFPFLGVLSQKFPVFFQVKTQKNEFFPFFFFGILGFIPNILGFSPLYLLPDFLGMKISQFPPSFLLFLGVFTPKFHLNKNSDNSVVSGSFFGEFYGNFMGILGVFSQNFEVLNLLSLSLLFQE